MDVFIVLFGSCCFPTIRSFNPSSPHPAFVVGVITIYLFIIFGLSPFLRTPPHPPFISCQAIMTWLSYLGILWAACPKGVFSIKARRNCRLVVDWPVGKLLPLPQINTMAIKPDRMWRRGRKAIKIPNGSTITTVLFIVIIYVCESVDKKQMVLPENDDLGENLSEKRSCVCTKWENKSGNESFFFLAPFRT